LLGRRLLFVLLHTGNVGQQIAAGQQLKNQCINRV
jgi:hypothetical protein